MTACLVELVDVDAILPKVGIQNESILRVRLDHVRMRRIMAADGEAPGRGGGCMFRSQRSVIFVDKAGGFQPPIRKDGNHRDAAADVIGHEGELACGINTHMCRTCATRIDRVQEVQFPRTVLNCKSAD